MGEVVKVDNSVEIKNYPASVTCLVIEQYRLINLIDEIRSEKKPIWSSLSIPIGLILSVLPSLLTNSFSDWLTIPRSYWWALFAVVLVVNLLLFVVMFIVSISKSKASKTRSSRQIFNDLIAENECNNSHTGSSYTTQVAEFEKKLREREIRKYMSTEYDRKLKDLDPSLISMGEQYVYDLLKKK